VAVVMTIGMLQLDDYGWEWTHYGARRWKSFII